MMLVNSTRDENIMSLRYVGLSLFLIWALGPGLTGCTTSTTNMTSPKALEPGEIEVNGSGQGNIDTRFVSSGIDLLDRAQNRIEQGSSSDPLTEQQTRAIFEDVISVALFRPTVTPELGARVGVTDAVLEGIDVGLRGNSNFGKADAKVQLWESGTKNALQALSFQAGVGRQFSVTTNLINQLTLTEFSRTDIDLMAMYGYNSEFFRAYVGPRYIYSWINPSPKLSSDFREVLPQELKDQSPNQFFGDETLQMYGATAGAMVGYSDYFLAGELTVMRTNFKPELIGQETDMSGTVFAPAVGLVTTF